MKDTTTSLSHYHGEANYHHEEHMYICTLSSAIKIPSVCTFESHMDGYVMILPVFLLFGHDNVHLYVARPKRAESTTVIT